MDRKPKVELEKVLQLKRFEKPEQEFWDEFDRGLRKKSMEALANQKSGFWSQIMDRGWTPQVAAVAAVVFCGVPAFFGVQSYYAEHNAAVTNTMVAESAALSNEADYQDRLLETTRELAMKKSRADNMKFVVDSYQVNPDAIRLEGDVWNTDEKAWTQSNRTYVNDRVELLPEQAKVLPANLKY